MDNDFVLRHAAICDINALSQLYQKSFRETFVEDLSIPYPEQDLDSYFRTSGGPEWLAKKINDPKQAIWVVEDKRNGELVAQAVAGSCDADDIPHCDVCLDKDAILNRLYVRRDRQNHGFGQQLMNVVLPWLEKHYPARPIWLAVWSQNFKAQKFYKHYDFGKVGDADYYVGELKAHDFIMKRPFHTS